LEESPQVPAEVTRTIVQAAPILPKAAEAAAAAVTEKPYVPKEIQNAIENTPPTTVHGDLRPQPVEVTGEVPAAQGSGGIQPRERAAGNAAPVPEKAPGEVPLIDRLRALKSTEEGTALGRSMKTPEGIAALEAGIKALTDEFKAGKENTLARNSAREALNAAKGEEGALANPPVRVKVIEQATGEEPIKYVSIQAEGNTRSGDAAYWRKQGFDVPDFDNLPPGEYTLEAAKAKLKESNAPKTQPAEPVAGSAPVAPEKPVPKAEAEIDPAVEARLKIENREPKQIRRINEIRQKRLAEIEKNILEDKGDTSANMQSREIIMRDISRDEAVADILEHQEKRREHAAEFNKLLEQHGEQLGYIQRPDAIAGRDAVGGGGSSTASIKAKILGDQEMAASRRRAVSELGGDANDTSPAALQKALPALKEKIRQYEEVEGAGVATEIPEGASTDFLPPEEAKTSPGKFSEGAKIIADKLREQFKTPDTGKELGTFGAVPKVINAAVELAAKIIERGGSLADAIGEAIDYIKRNHKGWFDEAGFRKFMEKEHASAAPPSRSAPPPPPSGPPPPARPSGPAPIPPAPAPAPRGAAASLRQKVQNVRDYMTVDPIPKLTRNMGEASQSAFEHAKARGAVPSMINNMLAKVFPEQFHDPTAMARTGEILKKDDILGGYHNFLRLSAEANAAGDVRGAAKFRRMADAIGTPEEMAAMLREVEAARNDRTIAGNIARWKEIVNPELDQLYNEMKGMDPATEREGRGHVFGARVNLLSRADEGKWMNALTGDETTPVPQQSSSNYRNPNAKRDKFDRLAKFTGDYSDNPAAMLSNVLFHRWNEVTKLRFYNDLVRTENAAWEKPASETIKGEKASPLPVKVPETNEAGVTRQVEKTLWVPESLVSEIRGVLGTDLNLKANPVGQALNKLQIYQLADFVAHTKNQVSAVANSPQMKSTFSELARRFPGLNVVDAITRIGKASFEIAKDSPEIRAELDWMSRRGLLREKNLYHEEGALNKPLRVTHDFLFRNDTAMRLVMNRFYNTLVENGMAPDSLMERMVSL
jgi:hypothetical protein